MEDNPLSTPNLTPNPDLANVLSHVHDIEDEVESMKKKQKEIRQDHEKKKTEDQIKAIKDSI
jgi:exopolysaccharide biosynthesis predicted pyruvyltransferase EpsI